MFAFGSLAPHFAGDHLPHPPVVLLRVVTANDHALPRTEVNEYDISTLNSADVIDRYTSPLG